MAAPTWNNNWQAGREAAAAAAAAARLAAKLSQDPSRLAASEGHSVSMRAKARHTMC